MNVQELDNYYSDDDSFVERMLVKFILHATSVLSWSGSFTTT
jgi:hypothetical protein